MAKKKAAKSKTTTKATAATKGSKARTSKKVKVTLEIDPKVDNPVVIKAFGEKLLEGVRPGIVGMPTNTLTETGKTQHGDSDRDYD